MAKAWRSDRWRKGFTQLPADAKDAAQWGNVSHRSTFSPFFATTACTFCLRQHACGMSVNQSPDHLQTVLKAEWLEDCSQLSRKRARGPPICGEVTSVSCIPQSLLLHRRTGYACIGQEEACSEKQLRCEMLGVHWIDAWSTKAQEWVVIA